VARKHFIAVGLEAIQLHLVLQSISQMTYWLSRVAWKLTHHPR
jgi:hypothetical protein